MPLSCTVEIGSAVAQRVCDAPYHIYVTLILTDPLYIGIIRDDLWLQKTRISGLSNSLVCVILRLAVLVEPGLVADR